MKTPPEADDLRTDYVEDFRSEPVTTPVLETTGLPEGDDAGYRNVRIKESGEKLVKLGDYAPVRPFYDGISPYTGEHDESLILPGGADDMYMRHSAAIAADAANKFIWNTYGLNRITIDSFRSWKRQAADFTRQLVVLLAGDNAPDTKKLYELGLQADGVCSWASADEQSPEFNSALQEIRCSREIMQSLNGAVRELMAKKEAEGKPITLESAQDEIHLNFITICANIQKVSAFFGENAPQIPIITNVPLKYSNNAHAGGGAEDAFLFTPKGEMLSHIPYNHVGPEAAIDFTEHDENFPGFCRRAQEDPLLRIHLQRIGCDPDNIAMADWNIWKEVNRIHWGVMRKMGATLYSGSSPAATNPYGYHKPKDGGETWHREPGRIVYSPRTQEIIHEAKEGAQHGDSGNPGHALQKMGRDKAVAVWGGVGAHQQLQELGVLNLE